jgi:NADH-quinone oxidoreductase subunit J
MIGKLTFYLIPLGILCAMAVVFSQNTLYIVFNFIIIILITTIIVFSLRVEFLAYVILIVYIGAIAILFLFVIMMLNLNLASIPTISTWELCIAAILLGKVLLVSKVMLVSGLVSGLYKSRISYCTFWDEAVDLDAVMFDPYMTGLGRGFTQVPMSIELWLTPSGRRFINTRCSGILDSMGKEYMPPTLLPSEVESLGHLLYVDFYYLFLMMGNVLLVAMVGALILTTNKNLKDK